MRCKKVQTADALHQGERPRICCHQRRDTAAQLEGQTLAENQYRKKNLKSRMEEIYEKNQVHIWPAGAVDALDGTGFCFFLGLYGCAGGRSQCTRVFLVLAECIFNPILASTSIRIAR